MNLQTLCFKVSQTLSPEWLHYCLEYLIPANGGGSFGAHSNHVQRSGQMYIRCEFITPVPAQKFLLLTLAGSEFINPDVAVYRLNPARCNETLIRQRFSTPLTPGVNISRTDNHIEILVWGPRTTTIDNEIQHHLRGDLA